MSRSASSPSSRGHQRGRERPAHRRRVPATRVEGPGGGHAQPRDDLVPRDGGGDERPAVDTSRLAHREGHRHHDGGGVRDRGGVSVVEVQAVGQGAVHEDGQRGGSRALGADDRAVAPRPPSVERAKQRWGRLAGGRRQRDAENVERAQPDASDDGRWQVGEVEPRREPGEPAGQRHAGVAQACSGSATLPFGSRLRSAMTTRPSGPATSTSSARPASSICCTSCSRSWPAAGSRCDFHRMTK